MRILHTSDWHLGATVCEHRRYEEFEQFFSFLIDLIREKKIDALLVAGDVFDNGTPSSRAQELYYKALAEAAGAGCRNILVTAGNHDSPAFLSAPEILLRKLHIHITASVGDPADEIHLLRDADGIPGAIVCSVPYLRERDVSLPDTGNPSEKNRLMAEGILAHYRRVCECAKAVRAKCGRTDIPLIAMGHLFATGGKTLIGDGVRELYVGGVLQIGADAFPEEFDYLALGHLHLPQLVGNRSKIRYCGSPLPLGFSDAAQPRELVLLETEPDGRIAFETIPVPCFQRYVHLSGTLPEIAEGIEELKKQPDKTICLEVEYTGADLVPNLRADIEARVESSNLNLLALRNDRVRRLVLEKGNEAKELRRFTPEEVFSRCMDAHRIPDESREALNAEFLELLQSVREADE